jgi:hypothetical protein
MSLLLFLVDFVFNSVLLFNTYKTFSSLLFTSLVRWQARITYTDLRDHVGDESMLDFNFNLDRQVDMSLDQFQLLHQQQMPVPLFPDRYQDVVPLVDSDQVNVNFDIGHPMMHVAEAARWPWSCV